MVSKDLRTAQDKREELLRQSIASGNKRGGKLRRELAGQKKWNIFEFAVTKEGGSGAKKSLQRGDVGYTEN